MKQILLLGILCALAGEIWAQKTHTPLFDAKKSGKLQVSIRGAYNPNKVQNELPSSHFGKCIDIKMQNTSDSTLHLILKSGTMLISKDTNVQNMVVTKTQYFILAPQQRKIDQLYAMCGQKYKNAPDIYIRYDLGQLGTPQVVRLAEAIEANEAQNKVGQYAVWAVTDRSIPKYEEESILNQTQKLLEQAKINFRVIQHATASVSVPITTSTEYEIREIALEPSPTEPDSVTLTPQAVSTKTVSLSATYETAKLTDNTTTEILVGVGVIALLAGGMLFYQKNQA